MGLSKPEVLEVVEKRMPGLDVVGLDVSNEINRDGLAVSFLTVRYRATANPPSAEQVINAVDGLVQRTSEGDGYPVLRLICVDDAPAVAAE